MKIPLEDDFNDILGKAQRGLRLSDAELSRRSGVSVADLLETKAGRFDERIVRKLAAPLNLNADALIEIGKRAWFPQDVGEIAGLKQFNTPFQDMTVNSYVIWDPSSGRAAAFDTGSNCDSMVDFAHANTLKIELILLTHSHTDHIFDLGRLMAATRATACICEKELIEGAEGFLAGKRFAIGAVQIDTRQTSGHSRGGITYVISGLALPIAIVGDALFAGSMGGGMVSYEEALRNNREHILTLPEDTILCCGHGPLTTVGQEKRHNPFFPELSATPL